MDAVTYKIMVYCVIQIEGKNFSTGKVYSKDKRLNILLILYFSGIVISFFLPILSLVIYSILARNIDHARP